MFFEDILEAAGGLGEVRVRLVCAFVSFRYVGAPCG